MGDGTNSSRRSLLLLAALTMLACALALVPRAAMAIEPDRTGYRAKDVAPAATNASDVLDAVPSVQVDDRTIGSGTPGPVTRALLSAYRAKAHALTMGQAALP